MENYALKKAIVLCIYLRLGPSVRIGPNPIVEGIVQYSSYHKTDIQFCTTYIGSSTSVCGNIKSILHNKISWGSTLVLLF